MKGIYLLVSMTMIGLVNLTLLKALEFYLITEIAYGNLYSNDLWFFQGARTSFPLWFQIFYVILGVILGFPVGYRWWYAVYVEKKVWRFSINWPKFGK